MLLVWERALAAADLCALVDLALPRTLPALLAALFPVGIEMRGFGRNFDVFDEFGNDGVHPDFIDEFLN